MNWIMKYSKRLIITLLCCFFLQMICTAEDVAQVSVDTLLLKKSSVTLKNPHGSFLFKSTKDGKRYYNLYTHNPRVWFSLMDYSDHTFNILPESDSVFNDTGARQGETMGPQNSLHSVFVLFNNPGEVTNVSRHYLIKDTCEFDLFVRNQSEVKDPKIKVLLYLSVQNDPVEKTIKLDGSDAGVISIPSNAKIDSIVIHRDRHILLTTLELNGQKSDLEDDPELMNDPSSCKSKQFIDASGEMAISYVTLDEFLNNKDSQPHYVKLNIKPNTNYSLLAIALGILVFCALCYICYRYKLIQKFINRVKHIVRKKGKKDNGVSDEFDPRSDDSDKMTPKGEDSDNSASEGEVSEVPSDNVQSDDDSESRLKQKHEEEISSLQLQLNNANTALNEARKNLDETESELKKTKDEVKAFVGKNYIGDVRTMLENWQASQPTIETFRSGMKKMADELQKTFNEKMKEEKTLPSISPFSSNDSVDNIVQLVIQYLKGMLDSLTKHYEQRNQKKESEIQAQAKTDVENAKNTYAQAAQDLQSLKNEYADFMRSISQILKGKDLCDINVSFTEDSLQQQSKAVLDALNSIKTDTESINALNELKSQINSLTSANQALDDTKIKNEKRIGNLQSKCEQLQERIDNLNSEKAKKEEEYKKRIQDTQAAHDKELNNIKESHENEKTQINEAHAQELNEKEQAYKAEKERLEKTHLEMMEQSNQSHIKEIDKIRAEALLAQETCDKAKQLINDIRDSFVKSQSEKLLFLSQELERLYEDVKSAYSEGIPLMGMLNNILESFNQFKSEYEAQQQQKWHKEGNMLLSDVKSEMAALLKPGLRLTGWINLIEKIKAYSDVRELHDLMRSYGLVPSRLARIDGCVRAQLGAVGIKLFVPCLLVDDFNSDDYEYDNSGTLWIRNIVPNVSIDSRNFNGKIYDLHQVGYEDGEVNCKPKVFYYTF